MGGFGHGVGMDWISRGQWDVLQSEGTDVHRLATGGGGWLDRYGGWLLWSGGEPPVVDGVCGEVGRRYGLVPRGYLARQLVRKAGDQKSAELLAGEEPGEIVVREGGLFYEVEPAGGYSTGLFLDQRLNRRRVAKSGAKRMLNLFAYTGSFTVCAAAGGAVTCSVDASKRALARGRRNLELNGIASAAGHRFLADDAVKIAARLAKRGEAFDWIVLDPPTFGRAVGGVFRVERDLSGLVRVCWNLLESGGRLLVSCNYARWGWQDLRSLCAEALRGERFEIRRGALPPEIPHGAVSCHIVK